MTAIDGKMLVLVVSVVFAFARCLLGVFFFFALDKVQNYRLPYAFYLFSTTAATAKATSPSTAFKSNKVTFFLTERVTNRFVQFAQQMANMIFPSSLRLDRKLNGLNDSLN